VTLRRTMTTKRRRVVVLYRFLPQYRRRFYELLRRRLEAEGVEFRLIYGDGDDGDRSKRDLVYLPWAQSVPNRILTLFGLRAVWQPALRYLRRDDLVIVEQATKLLLNYWLHVLAALGLIRLAYWGHGRNFQATSARAPQEGVKAWLSRRVHWWFAYNDLSRSIVESYGFPKERITSVDNAIDTNALRRLAVEIDDARRSAARERFGLKGQCVGLYIGAMYKEKRLEFLMKAAARIRHEIPDFELLLVGSGPDAHIAAEAASAHPWVHYLGPLFDHDKAHAFAVSRVVLLPGAVGLAILDSFACGVPLVTTDVPFHGPEIDYLDNGRNGLMTPHDADTYAEAVVRLMRDQLDYESLRNGAVASARRYTVENMVDRFASGIFQALDSGTPLSGHLPLRVEPGDHPGMDGGQPAS
jgi:glycosyltransferase involved in cell wall biosynthesis